MGGCLSQEISDAVKSQCNGAAADVKDHLTDLSTQIMGGEERQSGGIRLLDLHGGGAGSFIAGAVIGVIAGGAITAIFVRRMARPWKRLATAHEQAASDTPMAKLSRSDVPSRLHILSMRPGRRQRRPSLDSLASDRGDRNNRRRRRRSQEFPASGTSIVQTWQPAAFMQPQLQGMQPQLHAPQVSYSAPSTYPSAPANATVDDRQPPQNPAVLRPGRPTTPVVQLSSPVQLA